MFKYGILLLVPLLILGLTLCGRCLADETGDETVSDEDIPTVGEVDEQALEVEEVDVDEQVVPEEEPAPEAAIDAVEEVLSGDEATPEKEVTRQDLLELLDEVQGKRERRRFKAAYWAAGLEGDKKRIFDIYGHPSTRYREDEAGVLTEKWTYIDEGKQFIFRGDKLKRTRNFSPGTIPRSF